MGHHTHEGHSHCESPMDSTFVRVDDPLPQPPEPRPLSDESRLAVRKLVQVTVIALTFMLMEFVGGYLAGSLAVISDAVHMLTDVLGFVISLAAIWIGRKPASDRLSFGFHRVEIVGAMLSIMVIWVLTGILVYSAVLRFVDFVQDDAEQVVEGQTMFIIAFIGLVMNVVMMKVLGGHGHGHSHSHGGEVEVEGHSHSHSHSHTSHEHDETHAHRPSSHASHSHSHGVEEEQAEEENDQSAKGKKAWLSHLLGHKFENLNIQAAYLHVLGDLLQSVGVTVAGALIWWKPSWQVADPIMTLVFSILVVATTMGTVNESLRILMEGTPRGVEPAKIESGLRGCASVVAVHDLHIWSLSTNKPALAVHLVSDDPDATLASAQDYLIAKGITHTTIQIERPATTYPQQCVEGGRCT